ncbi:hypothetical protein TWF694_005483 [Orbilia ellipsospora]|uniref:Uncharacterized protein n=1 Tax=Orbilia ellipsospora TaxID=2528407 RepID=A0AAV9WTA7_9PEZI
MPVTEKVKIGAAAVGSVYALSQLVEGIQSDNDGDSSDASGHYLKAAASAAVAIGAYEMLRKERKLRKQQMEGSHHKHHSESTIEVEVIESSESEDEHDRKLIDYPHHHSSHQHHHNKEDGHTRRMLEEIAGVYALGRELMGDKKHHITHLVAETIGALGAVKEAQSHLT